MVSSLALERLNAGYKRARIELILLSCISQQKDPAKPYIDSRLSTAAGDT
jgi:hypothetical protein